MMNTQGIGSGVHSATLKGKINSLEVRISGNLFCLKQETIKSLGEELNFYKKEIQTLRSEKDTLEDVLNRKTADIRKGLAHDVLRYILHAV